MDQNITFRILAQWYLFSTQCLDIVFDGVTLLIFKAERNAYRKLQEVAF